MLKRRPKFTPPLLITFYLHEFQSNNFRGYRTLFLGEISSLGRSRPVYFSMDLSSFGKVWSLFTLTMVCWFYLLVSRKKKKKKKKTREEKDVYTIHSLQFHAENSERFSKDLDFSLWTRVTLTFVYESIIITALNHIPLYTRRRFDFTITRNKRDIRDRERPLKIMLFVSLAWINALFARLII